MKAGILPLTCDGTRRLAVARDASPEGLDYRRAAEASGVKVVDVTRYDLASAAERTHRDALRLDAGQGLFERNPWNSARLGILAKQHAGVVLLNLALIGGTILDPARSIMVLTAVCIILLVALVIFQFLCMGAGAFQGNLCIAESDLAALKDGELPSYTVMVPMLREREATVQGLVEVVDQARLSEGSHPGSAYPGGH